MNILAVCKDPGGTNGILPVVAELRRRGHHVRIVANGWASHPDRVTFDFAVEAYAVDALFQVLGHEPIHAVLTSTCTKGGVGMILMDRMRDRRKKRARIALQDIWGGALCADYWSDRRFRPSHILSNDVAGTEIMQRAWPDFPRENIYEVGFPAMDHYATFDVASTRLRVREEREWSDDKPVVLFAGGGPSTGATLAAVVRCLNAVGTPVTLVVRPHPRMRTDYADEVAAWDEALAAFRTGTLITDGPRDVDDAVAASDLVIADASTVQITASVMLVPSISVLYEDLGMRAYRQGQSRAVTEFPLVELGCAAKATNDERLQTLLTICFENGCDLGLHENQVRAFGNVGRAADRAADAVERIVQSS